MDPPEKQAPQCAVHNFPHNIDQCLVLAHSEFVGNFEAVPNEAKELLEKALGRTLHVAPSEDGPYRSLHRRGHSRR